MRRPYRCQIGRVCASSRDSAARMDSRLATVFVPSRPAFVALETDAVVVDLGHPWAHTSLRSPRAAADAVCAAFDRVFIVIRDDPALLSRSIDVFGPPVRRTGS